MQLYTMDLLRVVTNNFMCCDLYNAVLEYLTIDDRLSIGVKPSRLSKKNNVEARNRKILCHTYSSGSTWMLELKLNDIERRSLSILVDKDNSNKWIQFSCRVILHYYVGYTSHNVGIWKLQEPRILLGNT